MSSDTSAAARRIMDELGEEQRIPLFNVKQGNVGVLFGFPIAGLLLGSLISHALVLPLILVGVTLGVATTYAAPPHLTAWTWLRDATHYYLFRPRMTLSQPADAAHDSTEGGLVHPERTNAGPDERPAGLAGDRCCRTRRRIDGSVHRGRTGEHGLRDVRRLAIGTGGRRSVR